MLKRRLKKADFDGLSDAIKEFYEEKNGEFFLKVDDADELMRAKEHEKEARRQAEADRDAIRKELDEFKSKQQADSDDKSRKSGDVDALEKSWAKKYAALEVKLSKERDGYKGELERTMISSAAESMAKKISTMPKWMAKDIAERFTVQYGEDGKAALRILDANGQISAMNAEELENEFLTNKEYSGIVVGSRASGSATAAKTTTTIETSPAKSLSDMKPKELVAHLKGKEQ